MSYEANGVLFVDTFMPEHCWRIENGTAKTISLQESQANQAHFTRVVGAETVDVRAAPPPGPTPATDAILDLLVPRITLPVSKEAIRALLRVYLQVQMLRQRLHARPILVMVGPPDSGKTEMARIFGLAWFGRDFRVTTLPSKLQDFWLKLSKAPLNVFDNVEDAPKWFADAIAGFATGAEFSTKALYTDNNQVVIRPDTFAVLTAMSPSWLRGDILDRSLVIPVQLIASGERMDPLELTESVSKHRADFIAETIATVCAVQSAAPPAKVDSNDRLIGFETLGARLAETIGGESGRRHFLEGFRAAREARYTLAAEADAEVGALLSAVSEGPVEHSAAGFLNMIAGASGGRNQDLTEREAHRMGQWFAHLKRRSMGIINWTKVKEKRRGEPQLWRAQRR